MKFFRAGIFLGLVLLPGIAAAQQAQAAKAPKLVPALGWDLATQGGFPTSVIADAQNNVWVGTEGNGLWRYAPRGKKWTQFTTKDGLGDDYVYALAVDKLGRVWAGHLNHGVSVWNGEKWKNYGVLDGPLGGRVFAIATCPTDGDVWIATDCGAARYSIADDDWDYFTRASGLPSDQIQAIAFDAKGNIYLGTQCDGIAMANAKNHYQKWIPAPGLPQMPNAPTGAGLASNLINDMIVSVPPKNVLGPNEDERMIVATPLGLSTSSDYGDHFNFIRGEDWQDNVNGLADVPKPPEQQAAGGGVVVGGFVGGGPIIVRGGGMLIINGNMRVFNQAQMGNLLMEDWVTCLRQEKDTGRLWVGYRQKGLEIRNFGVTPSVRFDMEGLDSLEVRSIWVSEKTPALIAVYDQEHGGLKTPSDSTLALEPGDPAPRETPALPSPAKAPAADAIEPLTKRLDAFQNELKPGDAVYYADDWATGGDWVGRYGNSYATLFGFGKEGIFESEPGFSTSADIGPHHKEGAAVVGYVSNKTTDDPGALYSPVLGHRSEAEISDGSSDREHYPLSWEGPDLWLTVQVPGGIHTLSLYFLNNDAHAGGDNKHRDYGVELLQPAASKELELKETPMAQARVTDFQGGVYKQFIVAGPAKYIVRIARNRSSGAKLQGLFIDRAVEDDTVKRKPLPGFEDIKYTAPDPPEDLDTSNNPSLAAASDLWDKMVETMDKRGAISMQYPLETWAYRAAVASNAPPALLANWRWQLCIWTQEDRDEFQKVMADAFKAYSAKNPPEKKNETPSN